jgi:hypothetical protein
MFAFGAPSQYRLRACGDEEIQSIIANPAGTAFVVSTYWRLHFWHNALSGTTTRCFGTFDVPGCGTSTASDTIVCVAWHPACASLIVSTTRRRLTFAALRACSEFATLDRPLSTPSPIASSTEVKVEHGIVLTMRTTQTQLVAATSNGCLLLMDFNGRLQRLVTSVTLGGQARSHTPIVDFDLHMNGVACVLLGDGTLCGTVLLADAPSVPGDAPFLTSTDAATLVAYCESQNTVATVASSLSTLVFFRYDETTGFRDRRAVGVATTAWAEEVLQRTVSKLCWSPTGLLCVAIEALGAAIFHVSGVVVFTTFPRYSAGRPSTRQLLAAGPRACAFVAGGAAVAFSEPHAGTFEVLPLGQCNSSPVSSAPIVVEHRAVSVFQWTTLSVEQASSGAGWERLRPPPTYLDANAPLRYAALSQDGQSVAVVGRHGFAVHTRRPPRWRVFGSSVQEQQLRCVAEPAWLGNVALAVATRTKVTSFLSAATDEFAVELFPRNHLDFASRLCRVVTPGPPTSVRCVRQEGHMWCIVAVIAHREIFVTVIEIHTDSVHNPKTFLGHVQSTRTLRALDASPAAGTPSAASALRLYDAAPLPGTRSAETTTPLLVLLLRDPVEGPSLRIVTVDKGGLVTRATFPCFRFWVLAVSPPSFARASCIVSFSATGCSVITAGRGNEWRNVNVAAFDVDSIPLGICAGQLACGGEGTRHVMPRLFGTYSIRCTPVNVSHVALLRAFTTGAEWSPRQLEAASTILRSEGGFAATYDYLVHAVVHDDPPTWESSAAFDRRAALRRVLAHLRAYSEYYDVVVRCVRKGDVAFWRIIFDVVGSPHLFLEECVSHNRIREAVHFVRVLLMERPDDTAWSLEQSVVAARRLLAIVISRHDFELGYELLRFVALLVSEINLPPIHNAQSRGIGAIETMLRAVWPMGQGAGGGGSPASNMPNASHSVATPLMPPAATTALALKLHPTIAAGAVRPRLPSSPAEVKSSGSGGSFAPMGSVEDRVSAMQKVLTQNVLLRDMIDIEAQELLRRGHVIQLCRMFDAFALDVGHFMGKRYEQVADGVDLARAWRAMHRELGLPLAVALRQPTAAAPTTNGRNGALKAQAGSIPVPAAVRKCFGFASDLVCTDTQEYLSQCPAALEALRALERYFHHVGLLDFALLLDLLLLRDAAARALVRDSPRLQARIDALIKADPLVHPYGQLLSTT